MIYLDKPQNFNSQLEVVSCFIEHNDEILLLHRQDRKPEGNTWGVPAGKVNMGETTTETMIREIKEETGLIISTDNLNYFGKVYVKYPKMDFIYHMFSARLDKKPIIKINFAEHKNFQWISPAEALQIPLILDEDACIKMFYKI